ncbi:hypothetical protein KCU99_g411, partial [Aureobasidium melanogenum]
LEYLCCATKKRRSSGLSTDDTIGSILFFSILFLLRMFRAPSKKRSECFFLLSNSVLFSSFLACVATSCTPPSLQSGKYPSENGRRDVPIVLADTFYVSPLYICNFLSSEEQRSINRFITIQFTISLDKTRFVVHESITRGGFANTRIFHTSRSKRFVGVMSIESICGICRFETALVNEALGRTRKCVSEPYHIAEREQARKKRKQKSRIILSTVGEKVFGDRIFLFIMLILDSSTPEDETAGPGATRSKKE